MGRNRKRRRSEQRAASRAEAKAPRQEAQQEPEAQGSWYHAKSPALRFILITGGFMFLFYAFFYSSPEDNPTLDKLIRGYLGTYASASGAILDVVGFDARSVGTAVFVDERRVEVVRGCDAMEPIALFIAAVLAVQVSWRAKLIGLAGVFVLVFINLLRIMALTIVSAKFPDLFESAHLTVGQTVFVVCTLALWFGWVTWASKEGEGKEPDAASPA